MKLSLLHRYATLIIRNLINFIIKVQFLSTPELKNSTLNLIKLINFKEKQSFFSSFLIKFVANFKQFNHSFFADEFYSKVFGSFSHNHGF